MKTETVMLDCNKEEDRLKIMQNDYQYTLDQFIKIKITDLPKRMRLFNEITKDNLTRYNLWK